MCCWPIWSNLSNCQSLLLMVKKWQRTRQSHWGMILQPCCQTVLVHWLRILVAHQMLSTPSTEQRHQTNHIRMVILMHLEICHLNMQKHSRTMSQAQHKTTTMWQLRMAHPEICHLNTQKKLRMAQKHWRTISQAHHKTTTVWQLRTRAVQLQLYYIFYCNVI